MIRSPGYQPPQVQRLKFIPAKQGPFNRVGHNCAVAGFQSLPMEADMWALDNLNGAFQSGIPQQGQPQPQFAPQLMPRQPGVPTPAGPRVPGQPASPLFTPPAKPALPPIPAEITLTEKEKKQANEEKATSKPTKAERAPTPANEEDSGDDLLDGDELDSFDLEESDDSDEPAMPDAEPLPAPESLDDTGQTDQAKGPRRWVIR